MPSRGEAWPRRGGRNSTKACFAPPGLAAGANVITLGLPGANATVDKAPLTKLHAMTDAVVVPTLVIEEQVGC